MELNACQKGDRAELIACAWLIEQGYQVFRNVCSAGPADIMVWDPETSHMFPIDVKVGKVRIRRTGEKYHYSAYFSEKVISKGVQILAVCGQDCYWVVEGGKTLAHKGKLPLGG